MFIEKMPRPGRLDEIELTFCELEHWASTSVLVFTLHFDSDVIIVQYDIEKRLWDVTLDNSHFTKIPLPHRDKVGLQDAIDIVRKLLTYGTSKKANHINDLKKWREKLKVFPAKLYRMNQ